MGLGKQTGLSRPNDAALCEAAVAAQAQLRTSMTNVAVNVSLGLSDKMSDALGSLPSLTETVTPPSYESAAAYDAVDDMWMSTTEQMQLPSSSLRPKALSGDEKLCLADVVEQYRLELQRQAVPNNENIHLSLCGGMGAGVFVMRQVGAKFMKTILAGKEEIKHTICENLNPPDIMSDGGVDYAWHTDVHDITRDDIQKLGTDSIGRLDISAPCKDFALPRLLHSKFGGKLKNPRPGL